MYTQKKINSYFFKAKGFYIFHIPVHVPYQKIYQLADSAGVKPKQQLGPIIEQGKLFGFGWIGIEIEKPISKRDDVVQIEGDFEMYEYKGPYKSLGRAYKKISKDRPVIKDCYNLYLDDPVATRPEDCRTQVFFR